MTKDRFPAFCGHFVRNLEGGLQLDHDSVDEDWPLPVQSERDVLGGRDRQIRAA